MPIAGASFTSHNKGVFSKLHLFIEQEADEVAHNRIKNMRDALRYRRNLAGESPARYPRSDISTKGTGREGHSFAAWDMRKKGVAHYTLFNLHANSVYDYPYPYPRLIAYGARDTNGVWWKSVRDGTAKKLVLTDGKVFTASLPNGLTPYFRRQKTILIKELNTIIDDWNKK